MADALLGQLFQNLDSLIHAEIALLWGVEGELKKLSSTLESIRLVVEDAETKQSTDKMIAHWLKKLKNAAYDADDVLDLWATEVQLSQREFSSYHNVVSGSFLSCFPFKQVVFRHKIAKKIAKARDQFEDIFVEMSKLNLVTISSGGGERGAALLDPTRETSSLIYKPHVYGRDEDKDKIADMLIGNANHVSFLAILGIGGLGKTTLAQLVYNDERVEKHFDERIWICVSDDFSVQRLTRLTVESLSGKSPDLETLEALQNKMKELLSGKRFLLVLDDVWNDAPNEWNKLKASLTTCGAKGSSIVVTTRLPSVASIMKDAIMKDALSVVYPLRPLPENECWSLFEARALGVGEDELPKDVLEIGKQIVNKCRGVPLAVKVLGGLMCFKRRVREWESIRDNDLWKLPEGDAIMGILRLSYNHLRPQLKQCFSYCSIFPKDYVINKEELIQMWMANGFVSQSVVSGMELEDIGKDSFDELLRGSFFQDVEKDKFGEIESCKMHDLMHDLACHLTVGECCSLEVGKETKIPNSISIRHLLLTGSLRESSSSTTCHSLCKSNKSLRTLALPKYSPPGSIDIIMKTKLNYLRVLKLNGCNKSHISVGHMKCLRYLNLSEMWKLISLPNSICRLIHLQTLKLKRCYDLEKLPEEMKSMSQLRHLDIRECLGLREMPSEMGQMTSLHTLSIFIVGQKTGRRINELKGLKHLGGELKLLRLDLVEDATEAKESNLVSKRNLSSLELSWGYTRGRQENNRSASEEVLECLQPHSDVKELIIKGYPGGGRFPSWFNSLSNLVSLKLTWCFEIEALPPLGQLPGLKFLTICGMVSVKYIGIEFYGEGGGGERELFPSLENFSLEYMPNLERWEGRQREFPNLEEFEIRDCPKLETLDVEFPNLEKFKIQGCPKLETLDVEFTKLQELTIGECPKFETLDVEFPNLEKLRIAGCPKLKTIAGLPNSVKLQTMQLSDTMVLNTLRDLSLRLTALQITNLESSPFPEGCLQNLTALESLSIFSCNSLSIPDEIGNLIALTSLRIYVCDGLISLPAEGLQKLTSLSLTSLEISRCPSLKSLPEMGIQGASNSLVNLSIQICHGLTFLSGEPLRYLSSLQTLEIYACYNLELSNEAFQHLVSLRHLQLSYLRKMTSVPDVQNLTALQSLQIEECRNLRRLPQGLQHLTSLQTLHVEDCHPDLHKTMEKPEGEDWPIISHIPELRNIAEPNY